MYLCPKILNFGVLFFSNTKLLIFGNFYFIIGKSLNSFYYREFINVTVNIQINDIRQLPIVIPSADFLRELKPLYEKISLLKKEEFKGKTINRESYGSLEKQIDDLVNTLYAV